MDRIFLPFNRDDDYAVNHAHTRAVNCADNDDYADGGDDPPHDSHDSDANAKGVKEFGMPDISPRGRPIHVVSIIGQIEGHVMLPPHNKTTKYEHVIPLLAQIEQEESIKGVLFLLNTMGGDVEAGLAIAEMIASMSKPTVSLVLGGSHSIGVPLAVAANHSIIAPSATMTIHPIRMNGLVIGAIQTYDYFEKVQERVLNFITAHSSISKEHLRELMLATGEIANDVGTILFGRETVDAGVIDATGGVSDAFAELRRRIQPD